jgi:tRNA modification GTPase
VAIVAEEAGTTRDLIEVHLDLGGWPVTLVDTAGLRDDAGRVEAEGIRRALRRSEAADLVLWLRPADGEGDASPPEVGGVPIWVVPTKADLGEGLGREIRFDPERRIGPVSVIDGGGLNDLLAALEAEAADRCGTGTNAVPSRERHRAHLARVVDALDSALMAGSKEVELRADDLRRAGDELGRITGEIGVEDLLDVIFGEFCIGK